MSAPLPTFRLLWIGLSLLAFSGGCLDLSSEGLSFKSPPSADGGGMRLPDAGGGQDAGQDGGPGACTADAGVTVCGDCERCTPPAHAAAFCTQSRCDFACEAPRIRCGDACCRMVESALGTQFSCARSDEGRVLCWGSYLVAGDGQAMHRSKPVVVLDGAKALAAGDRHACALLEDAGVACWGLNGSGELGDGTQVPRFSPVPVAGLGPTTQISAGSGLTCALEQGVVCWGSNYYGQLGTNGPEAQRLSPGPVSGLSSGVTTVVAGGVHVCAHRETGEVLCWGNNTVGQVSPDLMKASTPVPSAFGADSGVEQLAAGALHTCALRAGVVRCTGTIGEAAIATQPTLLQGLTGADALALGPVAKHVCAVVDGGVWCLGANDHGQLGDGTVEPRKTAAPVRMLPAEIAAVAVGDGHSCAVSREGGLYCWGRNDLGQLGDGTQRDSYLPVPVR